MLAINPKIKQKAEDIRKKIFGSEVRESLASGIEAISEDVEATIGRQDYVEEQFQNVIDETTDKDVINGPEVIAARNGEANLKTRLDKEKQEVTAQLQHIGMVTKYGAMGNANFFDPVTKEYYTDSSKTTLANDDSQAFIDALEDNQNIYIPKGNFLITKPIWVKRFQRITGSGTGTLKIKDNTDVFYLTQSNILEQFTIKIENTEYNKNIFSINSYTLTHGGYTWDANLNIQVKNIEVYVGACYEGTVFDIWSTFTDIVTGEPYTKAGFWNIQVDNVNVFGVIGFYCKNWMTKADNAWITDVTFTNCKVAEPIYGFFGAPSELEMMNPAYKDISDLKILHCGFQAGTASKRFAFFTRGGKRIINSVPWDWNVYALEPKAFLIHNDDLTDYPSGLYFEQMQNLSSELLEFTTPENADKTLSHYSHYNETLHEKPGVKVYNALNYGGTPLPIFKHFATIVKGSNQDAHVTFHNRNGETEFLLNYADSTGLLTVTILSGTLLSSDTGTFFTLDNGDGTVTIYAKFTNSDPTRFYSSIVSAGNRPTTIMDINVYDKTVSEATLTPATVKHGNFYIPIDEKTALSKGELSYHDTDQLLKYGDKNGNIQDIATALNGSFTATATTETISYKLGSGYGTRVVPTVSIQPMQAITAIPYVTTERYNSVTVANLEVGKKYSYTAIFTRRTDH